LTAEKVTARLLKLFRWDKSTQR